MKPSAILPCGWQPRAASTSATPSVNPVPATAVLRVCAGQRRRSAQDASLSSRRAHLQARRPLPPPPLAAALASPIGEVGGRGTGAMTHTRRAGLGGQSRPRATAGCLSRRMQGGHPKGGRRGTSER